MTNTSSITIKIEYHGITLIFPLEVDVLIVSKILYVTKTKFKFGNMLSEPEILTSSAETLEESIQGMVSRIKERLKRL